MAVAALTLAIASWTHFGNRVPLGPATLYDPFRGAALPEAIIAGVTLLGLVAWLGRRPWAWGAALAATLVALAGVLLGLSIVLSSAARRPGDIAYHVSLLMVLVVTLILLLSPPARRAGRV
jgi:hypothetical protein